MPARKRYACIKPLRNALYQFAWQSTAQEAWAGEYYRRKRSEGKTHGVALRALANHWARILSALWRKRVPYEAAVFLQARPPRGRLATCTTDATYLQTDRDKVTLT